MNENQIHKKWAELISRSWRDEDFKKELLQNPVDVLKKSGIPLPPSIDIKIKVGSSFSIDITIPAKPKNNQALGSEALEKLAAGGDCWPH